MLVPGYEHHTWQCTSCSTVEQRMTFTREKPPIQAAPIEPAQTTLAEPTETAPAQPAPAIPVEPIPTVSAQIMPAELTKIAPIEPSQIVPLQSTHLELPAAVPKMNARAKALDEKLRNLKERAKAAREAARDTGATYADQSPPG
jgi:hypothetical protein